MPQTSQVIIVTGAAGNVGRAILGAFGGTGARLVGVDRASPHFDDVMSALPNAAGNLQIADADLTDVEACRGLVRRVLDKYGRVDGVAHTVGGFAASPAAESDTNLWELMFRLNTMTTLNMFQSVLPAMRAAKRGALVAISAGAALKAPSGLAAYSASKAGVLRLVESFADEVRGDNIRINAVMPGTIDTPQNRSAMPDADHSKWVLPTEVASTIAFLLSDASSGVTGAAIGLKL